MARTGGKAPLRGIALAEPRVEVEELPGGGRILRSGIPLEPYEDNLGQMLFRWADQAPERVAFAERQGEGWRELTYGQAAATAAAIGQALLDRGLGVDRPVMILSGNSVDHALLALGAVVAGVPYAPVSVPYSTMSRDFAKLRLVAELLRPGLVFCETGAPFARAIASLPGEPAEVVCSSDPPPGIGVTAFADLASTSPTQAVRSAAGTDQWTRVLTGELDPPRAVFVAEDDDGRVVCFVAVGGEIDVAAATHGEVYALNVDPDRWGRGVGRALLAAGCGHLRGVGFATAVLWVHRDNARACRFFRASGWRADGTERRVDTLGVEVPVVRYHHRLIVG